ncbi:MAG: endonuclease/exonuclease/phosphatase family protein [Promethearchaeota archaeon]
MEFDLRSVLRFLRTTKFKLILAIIFVLLPILSFGFVNFVHSRVSIKVTTVDSAENPIKLLTYNIFEYSLDKILPVLQEANADIIALQETYYSVLNETPIDGVVWLANKLDYYYYLDENNRTEIYGVSLLSRWPIIDQYNIELDYQSRTALVGIIDSPIGSIPVMATHLSQPYYFSDRMSQINQIVEESRNYSEMIIMGDFNTPDVILDEGYRILTQEFSDGWIASGNLAIKGRTWPANAPFLRIDYIWLKGDWKVIKFSAKLYGNPENSDHKGVYLEVTL